MTRQMLFALWDYWRYQKRTGRYSDDQSDGGMALAFVDSIPEDVIKTLRTGDLVFTQRLNSFLSWAMMYFTLSPVDHVAIYTYNENVVHVTLSGGAEHSIRAIAKGCRVLIARMAPQQAARFVHETQLLDPIIDRGSSILHRLSPKGQILVEGLRIIHGKYHDRFNWLIWAEFFSLLLFVSIILWILSSCMVAFVLPVASLITLIYYKVKNGILRLEGKQLPIMSHPDIGYRSFFKSGGLMFTRIGPIVVFDLGVLPLHVVLSLARERSDDGSDDEFKETREFFRDLVEGWDVQELSQYAEYYNSNQQDNK